MSDESEGQRGHRLLEERLGERISGCGWNDGVAGGFRFSVLGSQFSVEERVEAWGVGWGGCGLWIVGGGAEEYARGLGGRVVSHTQARGRRMPPLRLRPNPKR